MLLRESCRYPRWRSRSACDCGPAAQTLCTACICLCGSVIGVPVGPPRPERKGPTPTPTGVGPFSHRTLFGGSLAVYGREEADPVYSAGGAGRG